MHFLCNSLKINSAFFEDFWSKCEKKGKIPYSTSEKALKKQKCIIYIIGTRIRACILQTKKEESRMTLLWVESGARTHDTRNLESVFVTC